MPLPLFCKLSLFESRFPWFELKNDSYFLSNRDCFRQSKLENEAMLPRTYMCTVSVKLVEHFESYDT